MKRIALWLRRYVTVYGIIMLCTFFMCLLFTPAAELPVVPFFGRIMVFTLIALLSQAVYWSGEELTVRAWWGRTALQLLLLETLLLPLAHHWGFWHSGTDGLIYAGFILQARLLWLLAEYGLNAKTAAQINERIRRKRLDQRAEKE